MPSAAPKPRATLRVVLRLAFVFAMLAAVGQLLRIWYVRGVAETFAFASRDVIWMAPLAFLVLFSAVLLLQALAGLVIRPLGTERWLLVTVAALCIFSLMLHFRRIYPLASLVVAIGAAIRVAPLLLGSTKRRMHLLTRTGAAIAATLAILGAGERIARHLHATRESARTPAAGTSAPNVLLLILDTVRASSMSLYGYHASTTPALEGLAAQATVFDRAMAPSSWTLPSHASLFTGHRSGGLGVDWRRPYDGRYRTLAESFRDAGYATTAFTANPIYTTYESGLHQGFARYEDYNVSLAQTLASANLLQLPMLRQLARARSMRGVLGALRRHELSVPAEPPTDPRPAKLVVNEFLEWQRTNRERPFFAFLNVYDAHHPRTPPPSYVARFATGHRETDLYDASIAYLDAEVRRLVDSLSARSLLDRTVLVITSDHGEHFGEHGLEGHGNSLYLPLIHVPLIVRYPSAVRTGARVAAPVSLTDLPSTLLDLAGVRDTTIPGRSFAPASRSGIAETLPVLAEVGRADYTNKSKEPTSLGPMQSVVEGRWHFVRRGDGSEELFDMNADPEERTNVAAEEGSKAELARLRRVLASLIAKDPPGRTNAADGWTPSPSASPRP